MGMMIPMSPIPRPDGTFTIALPSAYPYQPAMIAIAGRITAQGP